MPQDWQLIYGIKGLVAPKEGLFLNSSTLLRGEKEYRQIETDDFSRVFFKVTVDNEEELREQWGISEKFVNDFLQIYGLITYSHPVIVSRSSSRLSNEEPLGTIKHIMYIEMGEKFNEEQLERYYRWLNHAIDKYKDIKSVFEDNGKSFLRNAIDYFYRSLGDSSLDEELIDLMISMESLFSKETQELHLRLSLRAAFLLGIQRENERPIIFQDIYELYKKRSQVVHGHERVRLTYEEISKLRSYVRESIKRLMYVEMPKPSLLDLIDKSIYDNESKRQLEQIITTSLQRW